MLQGPQWQLVQQSLVIGSFLSLSHFLLVFPGILSPKKLLVLISYLRLCLGGIQTKTPAIATSMWPGDGTSGSAGLAQLVAGAAGLCDQS